MNTLFRRLLHLLRWSREADDLQEEIEAHRSLRQAALERDGLGLAEAAQASRRAMGNVTLAVEDAREVWAMRVLDGVRQDVRAAVRGLRKSAGFALVMIGTLALGIGANTSLFSIFNSLIMRPLPVRDPEASRCSPTDRGRTPSGRRSGHAQATCSTAPSPGLVRASTSRRAAELCPWTAHTSAGASSTCSACRHSAAGCSHQPTTAAPLPNGPVAVISHRFWRQHFGGADDVVGRQLTVQQRSASRSPSSASCRRASLASTSAGWRT